MTKELGHYLLEGPPLGRGSHSTVRLARNLLDGTRWAVKIISRAHFTHPDDETAIVREMTTQQQLAHPHILRLERAIFTKSSVCMVLELADGGDLGWVLSDRGRLSEPVAKRLFRELLEAVGYCHLKRIAHRDIKPANILLDGRGRVKLADFGLSRRQLRATLKERCGTPHFVAPEIVTSDSIISGSNGGGYNGFRSDAWSCGVTLFQMLAGRLPFDAPTEEEVLELIIEGSYEMDPLIPAPAADLIRRLLTPSPEHRLTVHDALQHPWLIPSSPAALQQQPQPAAPAAAEAEKHVPNPPAVVEGTTKDEADGRKRSADGDRKRSTEDDRKRSKSPDSRRGSSSARQPTVPPHSKRLTPPSTSSTSDDKKKAAEDVSPSSNPLIAQQQKNHSDAAEDTIDEEEDARCVRKATCECVIS